MGQPLYHKRVWNQDTRGLGEKYGEWAYYCAGYEDCAQFGRVDIELSVCRLFSAWKIVGMTMTCNRCDVMNIMWRKTEMEQKSDRESF